MNTVCGVYISAGTSNGGADTTGHIDSLSSLEIHGLKTAGSTIDTAYGLLISGISVPAAYDIYAADAGAPITSLAR